MDEFYPRATRTLYVGNISKEIVTRNLHDKFSDCGEILEIDIKKNTQFALIQFNSVSAVCKAIRSFDGEPFQGAGRLKLAFAIATPTKCVWCHGLNEAVNEKVLAAEFGRFGQVNDVLVNNAKGTALIYFDQVSPCLQTL